LVTTNAQKILSAQDLLAGSKLEHTIPIPPQILNPGSASTPGESVYVRLRPLNLATLTLISRAARDDASLIPILMIKEALVEPVMTIDQIRQLHVGLVHYLVAQINQISGLTADGSTVNDAASASTSAAYLLLAKHFGWTPEQVSQLTPGQVAIYLAGIEKLLQYEEQHP
jgi:hypothetical protein